MAELDARQERSLGSVIRNQRALQVAGAVLVLLGGAYLYFGFSRYELGREPGDSFDRPIASLGRVFAGYQHGLQKMQTSTELETFLIEQVRFQTDVTASVTVLLVRLYVGTIVLTAGLMLLTVSVERRRLLALIRTLRE